MGPLLFALFIIPWTMTWTCTMLLTGSITRYGLRGLWRTANDKFCVVVLAAAVLYWPLFFVYGFAPAFTAVQLSFVAIVLIALQVAIIFVAMRLERQTKFYWPVS